MIFPIHYKWSNIMVLNVFYALGIYFLELNWSGSFLLFAYYVSDFVAKLYEPGEAYINPHNLEEYDSNYYSDYYWGLLSISFVCLGYKDTYLMTIDIFFFLILFLFTLYLWNTIFFVPSSGNIVGWQYTLFGLTTIIGFVFSLGLIGWIVANFKGVTWFSPIITTPFFLIYDVLQMVFFAIYDALQAIYLDIKKSG